MIASDGMWYYSEEHQLRILHENHGSTIDSHSLENKTYNKIREHFYWPNLRSDVKELVLFLSFLYKRKFQMSFISYANFNLKF